MHRLKSQEITAKLANQLSGTRPSRLTSDSSRDPEDDFRSGCLSLKSLSSVLLQGLLNKRSVTNYGLENSWFLSFLFFPFCFKYLG